MGSGTTVYRGGVATYQLNLTKPTKLRIEAHFDGIPGVNSEFKVTTAVRKKCDDAASTIAPTSCAFNGTTAKPGSCPCGFVGQDFMPPHTPVNHDEIRVYDLPAGTYWLLLRAKGDIHNWDSASLDAWFVIEAR